LGHVNARGEYSDTPLRSACSGGQIKIVELLIQKVNALGKYSGAPPRSACSGGRININIIELLLQKGADVNVHGRDSGTPCVRHVLAVTSTWSFRRGACKCARRAFPYFPSLGKLCRLHEHFHPSHTVEVTSPESRGCEFTFGQGGGSTCPIQRPLGIARFQGYNKVVAESSVASSMLVTALYSVVLLRNDHVWRSYYLPTVSSMTLTQV